MHANIVKHLHNVLKPPIKYTGFFPQNEITFLYDIADDVIMYTNTNEAIVRQAKTYLQMASNRNLATVTVTRPSFVPGTAFLEYSVSAAINISKFNGHFDHPAVEYSLKSPDAANIAVARRWDQFTLLEQILPHCERIALIQSYLQEMTEGLTVLSSMYADSQQVNALVTEQKSYLDQAEQQVNLAREYRMCAQYVTESTS